MHNPKEKYMAPSMELEAKNVEKAVQKACEQLNVSREKLKYDIISYGSSGIFGLGRTKKARIRVKLPKNAENKITDTESAVANDIKQSVRELIEDTFEDTPVFTFPDEPIELGKTILTRIVDAITSDTSINVKEDSDRIIFNVRGGNSAVLIGKHGQTLEAIQALVEKIVNKRHSERIRIEVDVEGYLENRKSNLQKQAQRLADKCRRIQKPVSFGFMNAYDRRVVHLALKDHDFVRTQSHGDGFVRKLMIFPKNNNFQRKRRNGYKQPGSSR